MKGLAAGLILLLVAGLGAVAAQTNTLFDISNVWRYATNNLDGLGWQAADYDDALWDFGGGLLFITGASLPAPKTTALPPVTGTNLFPTYYFRTSFVLTNTSDLTLLVFSNLIDDGAVFHLNGAEVQRVRMPPWSILYGSYASRYVGNATVFDVFSLGGPELGSVREGTNVLAVEVHQYNAASTDVVFGTSLSAVYGVVAPTLTRGPYLQLGTPWSVIVRWRTQVPCASRVLFGTNVDHLDQEVIDAAPTMHHSVGLTNLHASTRYYYAVGTASHLLSPIDTQHYYQTAPTPGTAQPIRIWAIGDAGTVNPAQAAVRDAYDALAGTNHTDVWLQLGDNAYPYGTDAEYQAAMFDVYGDLLARTVTWPALGNHDTAFSAVFRKDHPYFEIFSLPKAGEAGGVPSGTGHYYSFDYGNIHFVCLDSMTTDHRFADGAMADWLRMDLQGNTNQWIIAYWHHPPYSRGAHNSDTGIEQIEMRRNLVPILEAGGVDLVLTGHSHSYERSHLLDAHYGGSATLTSNMVLNGGSGRETNGVGAYAKPRSGSDAHQGTVYAVVGSSGMVSGGTLDHPAMFKSMNLLGSMVIDVNGPRLDSLFLRETGETSDWFTIVKGDYPLSLAAPALSPGGVRHVRGSGIPGRRYTIQSATNLTVPGWQELGTTTADGEGAFEYQDDAPPGSDRRFYRARQ